MMRVLLVLAALALVVWLGAAQLASDAVYGDLASPHSLPAALHRHDPTLLRPLLLGGRRARALAAIHTHDLAGANALLPPSATDATTLDDRGQLAQANGDATGALDAYVAAGDYVRAQALIDAVADAQPAVALRDERRLVVRLADDPRAADVAGQAWWRLGVLEATAGYLDPPHRASHWHAAQAAYERALVEAPNDESYVLAAAYQELANGDASTAHAHYERALQIDPASGPAYAGLALEAAAHHDCPTARANMERANALGIPTDHVTNNPTFGADLSACIGT
jgi:tetratricopeptide (TPR) repeat protein